MPDPSRLWVCDDSRCGNNPSQFGSGTVFFADGKCWTATAVTAPTVPLHQDFIPQGTPLHCVGSCQAPECPQARYARGIPCNPAYEGDIPYMCGLTSCRVFALLGTCFTFDPANVVPPNQIPPGSPLFQAGSGGFDSCCRCGPEAGGCFEGALVGGDVGSPGNEVCFPLELSNRTCCCNVDPNTNLPLGRVRVIRFFNRQINTSPGQIGGPTITVINEISGPPTFDDNDCATYPMHQLYTDNSGTLDIPLPPFQVGCEACGGWLFQAPRNTTSFAGGIGNSWEEACLSHSPFITVTRWDTPVYTCTRMRVYAEYLYVNGPQTTRTTFEFEAIVEGGSGSCRGCAGGIIQDAVPLGTGEGGTIGNAPPINLPCRGCPDGGL